jgi:hypothetical protein
MHVPTRYHSPVLPPPILDLLIVSSVMPLRAVLCLRTGIPLPSNQILLSILPFLMLLRAAQPLCMRVLLLSKLNPASGADKRCMTSPACCLLLRFDLLSSHHTCAPIELFAALTIDSPSRSAHR